MDFDPTAYGPEVARILALDGNGQRCAPLVCGPCSSQEARRALAKHKPAELFPGVREPEAPMAGLWLYFSCFEEAHNLIDDPKTAEGEYWHAVLHRQEPDAGNAAYWFRRVGQHPIFPKLAAEAQGILKLYPDAEFRHRTLGSFRLRAFLRASAAATGHDAGTSRKANPASRVAAPV